MKPLFLIDQEAVIEARIATPDLKPGQHAYRLAPAYSGGDLEVDSYPVPVVVNIDTVEIEEGMNCLLNHNFDAPLGGITNIKKTNKNGRQSINAVAVIGNTEASKKFFELESANITFRPSIGLYRTHRFKETKYEPGETFQANGREFVGPRILIDYGIISEISKVIIGGDLEAKSVLIAQISGGKDMNFEEWLQSEKNMTVEEFNALSEEEQSAIKAEFEEKQGGEPAVEANLDGFVEDEDFYNWLNNDQGKEITIEDYQALDEDSKLELQAEYIASQNGAEPVATAGLKKSLVKVSASDESGRVVALNAMFGASPSFLRKAVANGWSPQTANRIFEAKKNKFQQKKVLGAAVKTGINTSRENRGDVLLAAFGRTFGLSEDMIDKKLFQGDKSRCEPALKAAMSQFKQGCYYSDICLEAIGSRDRRFTDEHFQAAMYKSRENRLKMMANPALQASLGFSTIDASAIIDRVHQAYVEQTYELQEFVADMISKTVEVDDFTKIESYRPTLLGRIQRMADSGEIKNLSFTIEKTEAQAAPMAGILSVPEIHYINDDLGLFNDLMSQIATNAAIAYEDDFFRFLREMMSGLVMAADGNAFFSAARGNILFGASSSFSTTGLRGAIKAFKSARDKNGAPVLSVPKNLIVPAALEYDAMVIYESTRTNMVNAEGDAQPYGGRFAPLSSPFLGSDNAGDTGLTSDKAWLLTADPNAIPFVKNLKVRGFSTPRVESSTMDLAVWGTKMRVIFPYGRTVGDTRGAVLSLGE